MTLKQTLRPLCISLWSPPEVRPQAILIGKMLPEWQRQGVEPILFTYQTKKQWGFPVPTFYLPKPPEHRWLNKVPFLAAVLENNYLEKIYQITARAVKEHKPDLIFSFSNPQLSNIVGAGLKKRLGLPFIAHFSDPWYNNRYASRWSSAGKRTERLQNFVLENCDQVVFIAPELRDSVLQNYPPAIKAKANVVPHCFDLAAYPSVSKQTDGPFIISHLGIFRKDRTPEPLFAAVQYLFQKLGVDHRKIVIRLFGSTNSYTSYTERDLKNLITKYELEETVEIMPTVSFAESLRQMKLADCLVVIDANVPKCDFILSKVVDYAGSGTPSIGIMPSDNPTYRWLKNAGYAAFAYNETGLLADYLEKLLKKEITARSNQEFINRYAVRNTTRKLLQIFEQVVKK